MFVYNCSVFIYSTAADHKRDININVIVMLTCTAKHYQIIIHHIQCIGLNCAVFDVPANTV